MMEKYVTIDLMSGDEYEYDNEIEQGFALDRLLDKRECIGIPYDIELLEGAKVIIIRDKKI